MRDRGQQGINAVVERQQSVPSGCDNEGLFLDRQDRRSLGFLGPVGRSATEAGVFYFAMVFGLTPYRFDSALKLA